MKANALELTVLVNGKSIREFGHSGRTYIEGRAGTKYQIQIKNNSASRILAIPSIDGLSPLDGKAATDSSQGYLVPAYGCITVDGWRQSLEKVSTFIFGAKDKSYSAKTGQGKEDCGVIGVLVYEEKQQQFSLNNWPFAKEKDYAPYVPYNPWYPAYPWKKQYDFPIPDYMCRTDGYNETRHAYYAATNGSVNNTLQAKSVNLNNQSVLRSCVSQENKAAEAADFNLGTKWGEVADSKVTEVSFERGTYLGEFHIYYTDRQGLAKIGIDVDKKPAITKKSLPQAFGKFCQAPK